jgi:hypothetical protein
VLQRCKFILSAFPPEHFFLSVPWSCASAACIFFLEDTPLWTLTPRGDAAPAYPRNSSFSLRIEAFAELPASRTERPDVPGAAPALGF